ncbi:hypothetical protein SSSV7_gp11 [Sulfolobus spindle-shaped virus 7]|uniref:Uncharacterized protein n=1 Tax=Sulfolobus spindle-shaped virus 7 TaxID=693628 RepID=D1GF62_9VIRU|nr:hypothetical protein SSSV7_gp11 [Sulfolobus spindle-shaped virus 7]ACZ35764.1 hypothetical protein [Sulfolobus spindle-shaped virus 7]
MIFLMTVILLRDGKYTGGFSGECEKDKEVILENGDRVRAKMVCWDNGKLLIFTGTKVYEISFSLEATLVVEHDT